ncbi:predicted protein [Arabidopsis lyrata subsp. lyrata]|uniref:Predicted protein n=1 Tax=Arabidopsis lyrata subsp. lyrata TaxID=81972 RepID=D7M342_ARALL|nr:predicted protein [Arabidopsis lyrata subsp. lyrata]
MSSLSIHRSGDLKSKSKSFPYAFVSSSPLSPKSHLRRNRQGEHESRPPGIKEMKKLRKTKGKEKASASAAPSAASASPSAEFSKMFELKLKDLEGMKELQKLSILDSLIAKKENLDEEDKVVKKKLVAELFLT